MSRDWSTWRRAHTAFGLPAGRSSGYGLGWFVARLAGEPTVEHGGDINGFSSHDLWVPSARLHVYVLSNAERGFANPRSRAFTGTVHVGDIGCPREVIDRVSRS